MIQDRKTSFLFGGNAPYVEEQYEAYLTDRASVSEQWRGYFDALQTMPAADGSAGRDVAHGPVVSRFAALAKRTHGAMQQTTMPPGMVRKHLAVQALVNAYRMVGSRHADLDPLRWTVPTPAPELSPSYYGLSPADMQARFNAVDTSFAEDDLTLEALLQALEETYCGALGAEFMYLSDAGQRDWWQARLESTRARVRLDAAGKRHILERLTAAEGIEKYLHARFVGQKRFSLEGGEALIVLLDELINYGATRGIRHSILGMAHRGRLNVLVNVAGKPAAALFDEFEGRAAERLPAGDVKYHKGYTGTVQTDAGPAEVTVAFNPSHLEIVNPVVQGMARARAEILGQGTGAVLPIEIHGDASISGQGIVMETMNLSATRRYGTGGTVHIVVNNQVGFTTSRPEDARSTFYSSDIAKMIEAPVLHVNGDDPEAVVAATRMAVDFRATFRKSVVIELVCFRRHGHQEQDTPAITQPLMYRSIAAHPGVRTLYATRLEQAQVVTAEDVERYMADYRAQLDAARSLGPTVARAGAHPADAAADVPPIDRGPLGLDRLRALAHRITEVPEHFTLHPLVARMIGARREMAEGRRPLDWGMAEHLAYAALLAEGVNVRLSGQDSERGTFSHRHAVLHDQHRTARDEGLYTPLAHVANRQGTFEIGNSILAEAAVLGFEYGYSLVRQDSLVLWEAQFGDFANGAQVVIDNFLSAGEAKWGQRSGVTLLLPHGQEGQGPEHASARLERYLQLSAEHNLRVVQPTTPAQIFHVLREQAMAPDRVPLVVMTPKSLLRHPEATSRLEELASGHFQEMLAESRDPAADRRIEHLILCSGKVYFELLARRRQAGADPIALARVEQLYPFPAARIAAEIARYPNLKTVVWCQEEARNQGAWSFMAEPLRDLIEAPVTLRYIGPAAAASTAPGYAWMHAERQEAFLSEALALPVSADDIATA